MTGMQWLSDHAVLMGVGLVVFVVFMARRGLDRRIERIDAENRLADEAWTRAPQDGFETAYRGVDLPDRPEPH
ncbi:MAG: hypothetical protein ACREEB_04955 [Caulobacteraceae bacterium]